jgi:hypothetical protein
MKEWNALEDRIKKTWIAFKEYWEE